MSDTYLPLWDVNCQLGRWPTAELVFHDVAGLLARMDRLGITRAVVSHSHAWQIDPTAGNRRLMEELEAAPAAARDRLHACWAVVPAATEEQGSLADLDAALEQHGIRFVRLYPRDHNYSLSSPDAAELLAMLARRRVVALIDVDQSNWEEIDRVAAAAPELPIVVCRLGYRGSRRLPGVLARQSNVHIDLSYFGLHEGVEWLVERFGAERLLFGTGAPLVDGGGAVTRLLLAGISEAARATIGWGNLARLLGESAPIDQTPAPATTERKPAAAIRRGQPIRELDVIDAHAHVGPWFNFYIPRPDGETMMAVMDRCGVRLTVVSSMIAVGPDAVIGNAEVVALVRAHPDRFTGYAVFNPHHPGSAEDVAAALAVPGIVGIKIHPDTHAYPVTGPAYDPAWELATRHDVPVLTHTYAASPYCDPSVFAEVARRWPAARIILGHAGATDDGHRSAIRVAQEYPTLYLELCGSYSTGVWIRRMIDEVGADRVIFGSDFPFIDLRYILGRVVFADLSAEEEALVLGGNARRLLRLPPPSFRAAARNLSP